MSLVLPAPSRAKPTSDEELDHVYCECNPDVSRCGLDISDLEIITGDVDFSNICIVCDDIVESYAPCLLCGAV